MKTYGRLKILSHSFLSASQKKLENKSIKKRYKNFKCIKFKCKNDVE